jgi:hypothetical protein
MIERILLVVGVALFLSLVVSVLKRGIKEYNGQ